MTLAKQGANVDEPEIYTPAIDGGMNKVPRDNKGYLYVKLSDYDALRALSTREAALEEAGVERVYREHAKLHDGATFVLDRIGFEAALRDLASPEAVPQNNYRVTAALVQTGQIVETEPVAPVTPPELAEMQGTGMIVPPQMSVIHDKEIKSMSNDELKVAIDYAWTRLNQTGSIYSHYAPMLEHYKALLKEQERRATAAPQSGEGRKNDHRS